MRSMLGEAVVRDYPKPVWGRWSKHARVLCELLDEAREEFDQAVAARDTGRERQAFNEMLEIAKLLDEVLRCPDKEVDDLQM